ncbi:hypothetical protein Hypma_013833 [Hypsizygus marmoreus]|uniref:HNH nuclease domain-containing protein n=1 Tax=Hypsizygus marmoreus TaxID=39966 RepID=A0A369KA81_HYPMA|nr:hypothetical protein Hypma_013833 [Hypsizygus marmoreus]
MVKHFVPLPQAPTSWAPGTSLHHAYIRCLEYEHSASCSRPQKNAWQFTHLLAARVLGYLFLHAPTYEGREWLSSQILSCNDDDALLDLGKEYNDHLIRIFQRPPRYSGDDLSDSDVDEFPTGDPASQPEALLADLLAKPPSYDRAKRLALIRDGYRSVFSGEFDFPSILAGLVFPIPEISVTETSAAHVIPVLTNDIMRENGMKAKASITTVRDIIEHFGGVSIMEELSGQAAHRLENVLTLDLVFHSFFRQFYIWLEATTVPNQYRANAMVESVLNKLPNRIITFTSTDPRLPLPSPRYLALHAACAKTAHLSGVRAFNARVMEDLQESRTMKNDGGSAELLATALSRIATID